MVPVTVVAPMRRVVSWTVIGPTKVAKENTFKLDTLAVAIFAVE